MKNAINKIFEHTSNKSIDEYKVEEMEIALVSYGKVMSKRFIDTIPMII